MFSHLVGLPLMMLFVKMLFYTGFPNYKVILASFEYLDPGDNGENVRYWLSCDNEIQSL